MCSLPSWAQPIDLPELGNIREGDISRERWLVAHSEGEEARKLEDFGEFRGSFDKGEWVLGGFTLNRAEYAIQSKYF